MLAGATLAYLLTFSAGVHSAETGLAYLLSTIRTIFRFNGKVLAIGAC